eukprot:Rmarinus@m.20655
MDILSQPFLLMWTQRLRHELNLQRLPARLRSASCSISPRMPHAYPGFFSCEAIFANTTVAVLGGGASCLWEGSEPVALSILLGANAVILPDVHSVVMLDGTVLNDDENSEFATGSAVVRVADTWDSPVAVLYAPTTVGACDELTLDASGSSGSGGRDWSSIWWSVNDDAPNYNGVMVWLYANVNKLVTGPSGLDVLVPDSTYTFTVEVTNALGQMDSASVEVYQAATAVPQVFVQNKNVTVSSSSNTRVSTTIMETACEVKSELLWRWEQIPSASPWISSEFWDKVLSNYTGTPRRNLKDLPIEAFSLPAGFTYVFQVSAAYSDSGGSSTSDTATVKMEYSPLSMTVSGWNVAVLEDFVLDADACDPDTPDTCSGDDQTNRNADDSSFVYRWACVRRAADHSQYEADPSAEGQPCTENVDLLNALVSDNRTLSLSSEMLPPSAGWLYEFSVSVTRTAGLRTVSSAGLVEVLSEVDGGFVLDLVIQYNGTFNTYNPDALNPSVRNKFRVIVQDNSMKTFVWSILEGDLAKEAGSTAIREDALYTPSDTEVLGIAANKLTPGLTYQFRVDVTTVSNGWGYTYVEFTVNRPPVGGTLVAEQSGKSVVSGDTHIPTFQASDPVYLRGLGWSVVNEGDSRSYVFGYMNGGSEEERDYPHPLTSTSVNSAMVLLPASQAADGLLTLYVDVVSAYGGYTRTTVVVETEFDPAASTNAEVSSLIEEAQGSGDADVVLSAVDSSAAALALTDGDGREDLRLSMMESVSWAQSSQPFPTAVSMEQVASAAASVTSAVDELNVELIEATVALVESTLAPQALASAGYLTDEAAGYSLAAISNVFEFVTDEYGNALKTFSSPRHPYVEDVLDYYRAGLMFGVDCGEDSRVATSDRIVAAVGLLSASNTLSVDEWGLALELPRLNSSMCLETSLFGYLSVANVTGGDMSWNRTENVVAEVRLSNVYGASAEAVASHLRLDLPLLDPLPANYSVICTHQPIGTRGWVRPAADECTVAVQAGRSGGDSVLAYNSTVRFTSTLGAGFYATVVEPPCDRVDDVSCSGHGVCVAPYVCECDEGWEGEVCESAICESCSEHGTCTAPNVCECHEQYYGYDCSYFRETCKCNVERGTCVEHRLPALQGHGWEYVWKCDCDDGWTGRTCDLAICPELCSGNGVCVRPGECVCNEGWYTVDPSFPCAVANCSSCVHGQCIAPDFCLCDSGWSGANCTTLYCARDAQCDHGSCVANECVCDDGWARGAADIACSIPLCGNCTGHGVCLSRDLCECEPGYHHPPHPVLSGLDYLNCYNCTDCSGHGACEPDGCVCESGYTGVRCETESDNDDSTASLATDSSKLMYNFILLGCLAFIGFRVWKVYKKRVDSKRRMREEHCKSAYRDFDALYLSSASLTLMNKEEFHAFLNSKSAIPEESSTELPKKMLSRPARQKWVKEAFDDGPPF